MVKQNDTDLKQVTLEVLAEKKHLIAWNIHKHAITHHVVEMIYID